MSITYNEIKDQYKALDRTGAYIEASADKAAALLEGGESLVFVGCGSSYTLARSAALMAQLRLGKPSLAAPAGDMLLHLETYRPALEGATVIALSRSGETSEVIRLLESMREGGIRFSLLGVSCVEDSPLSKMSDIALEMPWAYDKSVCQTRNVSCLYYACAYLIAKAAGAEALLSDLRLAVEKGPAFLEANEAKLRELAEGAWDHAVVLADAELCGLGAEGALAFKEICQLPSNYYHLLDVRHGPMVLIGEKTLVIAVVSDKDSPLEQDLVADARKKGATVVTYSDAPVAWEGVSSFSMNAPLSQPARGLPVILICQLLAYYKSFQTGANPDQPDGLSPWIALR